MSEKVIYSIPVVFDQKQKHYHFCYENPIKDGLAVVVQTSRGIELGTVSGPCQPTDSTKLKPVLRIATLLDTAQAQENKRAAHQAARICRQCIDHLKLDMHLIQAEYTLDQSKILFTYVADQRVDFRQLLKDLANELHCRIDLRQVGPRNKAKMIGGIGHCGMETCCSRFLNDFESVSINMAKNQMLALNISKLSGQCGKLMCCLRYENDEYTKLKEALPKVHSKLEYDGQTWRIAAINVLSKSVKLENREEVRMVDFATLWPEKS